MFKAFVSKSHPEFSSNRQQDAQEFFLHLVNLVEVSLESIPQSDSRDGVTKCPFSLHQSLTGPLGGCLRCLSHSGSRCCRLCMAFTLCVWWVCLASGQSLLRAPPGPWYRTTTTQVITQLVQQTWILWKPWRIHLKQNRTAAFPPWLSKCSLQKREKTQRSKSELSW